MFKHPFCRIGRFSKLRDAIQFFSAWEVLFFSHAICLCYHQGICTCPMLQKKPQKTYYSPCQSEEKSCPECASLSCKVYVWCALRLRCCEGSPYCCVTDFREFTNTQTRSTFLPFDCSAWMGALCRLVPLILYCIFVSGRNGQEYKQPFHVQRR